jgi:hypothetical protein
MITLIGGLIVAIILISFHHLLREFTRIKKFDDKISEKEQHILKRYYLKLLNIIALTLKRKRGKHC